MFIIYAGILLLIIVAYTLFDYILRLPGHLIWPNNRCILITGCGSGFGLDFVKRCVTSRGCTVFAACRTSEGVNQVTSALNNATNLKAFVMDVSSDESVQSGFQFVKDNLPPGGLWAVVNNAGITPRRIGPIDWLRVEDYSEVINVNYMGTVRVTKAFLPLLKQTKGRIVNISSLAGRLALSQVGPYSASKFAVEGFSDVIRQELSPFGVSVHVVTPGIYKTSMTDVRKILSVTEQTWMSLPEETKEEYGEQYYSSLQRSSKDQLTKMTDKVYEVTSSYENAVFAWWPKTRYLVGSDVKFICKLSHLSEWFTDGFLALTHPNPPIAARQVLKSK